MDSDTFAGYILMQHLPAQTNAEVPIEGIFGAQTYKFDHACSCNTAQTNRKTARVWQCA